MSILIIGGGIAGLSHGLALQQLGIQVSIYEQASEIKPVGAGLALAKNALSIYGKMGLLDEIQVNSTGIISGGIYDKNLKAIASSEINENIRVIHRAKLHEILLSKIDPSSIHVGKAFVRSEYSDNKVNAYFADGSVATGTVLIGADGIYSNVRKQFTEHQYIRSSEQTCWRGVLQYDLPKEMKNRIYECWGGKSRFGFMYYSENEVYWFAVRSKAGENQHNFSHYFKDFKSPIHDLIMATEPAHIHKDVLCDIVPKRFAWYKDYVCLIGDAAHATTPNMGQGACQAIEDAYLLALLINKYGASKQTFKKFQTIRERKVNKIVNQSWQLGKVAHTNNRILKSLLHFAVRNMPNSTQEKMLDMIYDVQYLKDI